MANDVIPVLESLRQGQYESEASLGYINSKPTWITQSETVTKNKQTNKHERVGDIAPLIGCLMYTKLWVHSSAPHKLGMVVHVCNLSNWKMRAEGPEVQGHLQSDIELEASLVYETPKSH